VRNHYIASQSTIQSDAVGESIGSSKHDIISLIINSGCLQQGTEWHASPFRRADEFASHRIPDTFERHDA
jgi:hypothetical protein